MQSGDQDATFEEFPGFLTLYDRDIKYLAYLLAEQIKQLPEPITDIVAIARGGLVPAALLMQYEWLKDAKLHVLRASSYEDGETSKKGGVTIDFAEMATETIQRLDSTTTLLLDDLWDSGDTIKGLQKVWPLAQAAVLLSKSAIEQTSLDLCGMAVPISRWVVFPWEDVVTRRDTALERFIWLNASKGPLRGLSFAHYCIIADMWRKGNPVGEIVTAIRMVGADLQEVDVRTVIFEGFDHVKTD